MRSNAYWREETISSPLAEAMSQLVGIAGGIYLSLVMLVSFLGIEMPQKVNFLDMLLDPLALLSILLACLQPLVLLCLRRILSERGR